MPMGKRNIVPPAIKAHPDWKPFYDGIGIILATIKAQNSLVTKKITLAQNSVNMEAQSNYGITIQHWFDHNFAHGGIIIEWKA